MVPSLSHTSLRCENRGYATASEGYANRLHGAATVPDLRYAASRGRHAKRAEPEKLDGTTNLALRETSLLPL